MESRLELLKVAAGTLAQHPHLVQGEGGRERERGMLGAGSGEGMEGGDGLEETLACMSADSFSRSMLH